MYVFCDTVNFFRCIDMVIWIFPFQATFVKLWEANISFVMSVCQSVWPSALNITTPTGRIFMKSETWEYFENISRKSRLIKTWQEWRVIYMKNCILFIILRWILRRMKNVSDESCRKNQNAFWVKYISFRKSCLLWTDVEICGKPDRPQTTV